MYLDNLNQYATAQTLTATGDSTNIIDHGADNNTGVGEPMAIVIDVDAIDGTSGDETYVATLVTSDSATFASGNVTLATQTIARATAANTKFAFGVPPVPGFLRYSKITMTLGGTTPSITFDAWMQPQNMLQNDYVFPTSIVIE